MIAVEKNGEQKNANWTLQKIRMSEREEYEFSLSFWNCGINKWESTFY